MILSAKNLAIGMCLYLYLVSVLTAHADGVDAVIKADGNYIDDIEIIGDATLPSGEVFAVLEMRNQHLKFFVDPDAIYVMMDKDNPILTEQTPFDGFWISTQSVHSADWPPCRARVLDENGARYLVHGTLVWTNTAIADNGYDLAFTIDLGTCGARPEAWGYSRAAFEMAGLDGVPHPDIPDQGGPFVTDVDGVEYYVEIAESGATLVSVNMRTIFVPMATAKPVSEIFVEQEVFVMYPDCTTSSERRGFGTWALTNGGFFVDFETISFSFLRMEAPVDNGRAC